jgi:hypothetical protein
MLPEKSTGTSAMPAYEYRVIPAPQRGEKGKGVGRDPAARFAHALESVMNDLGRDGWDYVRSDTLPCEERTGLTGRTTTFQNMLVFRRTVAEPAADLAPRVMMPAPVIAAPAPLVLVRPAPQVAAE